MLWRDVNQTHHNKRASVSAKSTPTNEQFGEGPIVGVILCAKNDAVPILRQSEKGLLHSFAWWWEVEILD